MLQKVYAQELEQLARLAEELNDWKSSAAANNHSTSS
jgi:hypothetical protein